MKKVNTTPLSGTQEFLPQKQAEFDDIKAKIIKVFREHGYMHIETPSIDRLEILLSKAGGDTEKQIYRVLKTGETGDEITQGLRFDHTVPLARYVVEHENKLTFPLKTIQIGRNWRGERAQKGRFREFYQCDVDVIGRGKLDLAYDADIIGTLLDAYASFELDTPVVVRISNRKILSGFLRALGLANQSAKICNIIDHADKISREEVKYALGELGLEEGLVHKILSFIDIRGPREEVISRLEKFALDDDIFAAGLEELHTVMLLLDRSGHLARVEADLKIVRGLDYYTGTVFEFGLPEYKSIGSIGGGGRYENLADHFTDQKFPGVGGSIGLSRLFYVLEEHNLLKGQVSKPLNYAIIPISDQEIDFANKIARDLRREGHFVSVVYFDKRLADKLAYAAKLAEKAIVVGPNEVESGNYKVKKFT